MSRLNSKIIIYVAWLQTIAATFGGLYYSEVNRFAPCTLCWYQRIMMFPLVLIIAIGILRKDDKIHHYVLPLSLVGWVIAFYHVLLEKGLLPEAAAPCSLGVSCTTKYVGYLGFITIPVMSLAAFSVIIICMLIFRQLLKPKALKN
jgi:disulfide bond formation protein DsbB